MPEFGHCYFAAILRILEIFVNFAPRKLRAQLNDTGIAVIPGDFQHAMDDGLR